MTSEDVESTATQPGHSPEALKAMKDGIERLTESRII